ncbi:hypothetical protein ACFQFH_05355 [Halobaculum halobium]|uniref:DUF7549 family protein n=1 Tax=Halobaculum halobium TaxID=3032281 RepID=UPI00360AED13
MVWVRSEYAGELAVLSTWVAALLPWNLFYGAVAGGTVLFVRFPLFQIRYAFGVPLVRATSVSSPVSAYLLQSGTSVQIAYGAWLVGACVFLVALGVSVYYYREEERAESWRVDPVDVLADCSSPRRRCFSSRRCCFPSASSGSASASAAGSPVCRSRSGPRSSSYSEAYS